MKHGKNKRAGNVSRRPRKDPIQAAAEYGIDIPMLTANLARTPAERVRRHQIALEAFQMFRRAKRVGPLDETKDIGEGLRIRVLTVDSLIKAKKAMNRQRDKDALLQLEAIRKMRKKHRKP
jgi:hypothetical protein